MHDLHNVTVVKILRQRFFSGAHLLVHKLTEDVGVFGLQFSQVLFVFVTEVRCGHLQFLFLLDVFFLDLGCRAIDLVHEVFDMRRHHDPIESVIPIP